MKLTAVLLCFFFYSVLLNAQENNSSDSLQNLKEVIVTYQADKHTPVSFQNIRAKELKLRLTGQEPSFLLTETPSITNFSDAGSSQGYSYLRMRGIDQTRINITLDGVPLNEPIARYGPFVMITEREIRQAFEDYVRGRMGAIE